MKASIMPKTSSVKPIVFDTDMAVCDVVPLRTTVYVSDLPTTGPERERLIEDVKRRAALTLAREMLDNDLVKLVEIERALAIDVWKVHLQTRVLKERT